MFTERIAALSNKLLPFEPGWRIDDRTAWQTLDADHRVRLLETARSMPEDWPSLPTHLYLDFTRNGRRDRFEAPYMLRRRMLCALILAECASDDGLYLDRIVDGALLLCEESGWQLPAHNSYVRDTPCLPLPDPDRPVIDLFAAETGALLATLLYLLRPRLDAISPTIADRIERELRQRIIDPYLTERFWWMGNGDERMCNWTAWCTQNVLLTAFLMPLGEDARHAILAKSASSLDAFLKDYGDDGACEEGVLYYHHAALCLFGALSVMSSVAPEAFSTLWTAPKIRNMAEFVMHMHVADDLYFNFADSAPKTEFCGARVFQFGQAVGSPALTAFALDSWKRDPAPDLPHEVNLFYRLQTAQMIGALKGGNQTVPQRDHYYPSIGLMIARDERYTLAVKAGNNGEDHNHNDVGSITLYKDGKPFLIDVGVETYTAKTFSPQRYEIWTMQSQHHNLPSFDGIGQLPGREYAARDVQADMTAEQATMSMDIAPAYAAEAQVLRYLRRVEFLKGKSITITDKMMGVRPATLSLMVVPHPKVSADSIHLPSLGTIKLEGAGTPTVESIAVHDERLRQSWPQQIHRILIPIKEQTLTLRID